MVSFRRAMKNPEILIRNARYMGRGMDLAVGGGVVVEFAPAGAIRAPDAEFIDAGGMTLLPALIDCHAHLREPGQTRKEDIGTGLTAAAHGGFARVLAMANTSPVNDVPEIAMAMLESAKKSRPGGPALHPVAALTRGLAGREITDLAAMRDAGCIAASNDGEPVADTAVFREALIRAKAAGLMVIDHCEDPYLNKGAGLNLGRVSEKFGYKAQPASAEAIQVARDVILASELDARIHLAHISCRESVEIIARAKEKGVPVTAETCPHYLLFTEDEVERAGTLAKVNPPLRSKDDVIAVRQALRQGVIDCLATDHAPHAADEKASDFENAPCGISGLDTALSICLGLANEGELSETDLVRAWHTAPARVFGFRPCLWSTGDPADFVLADPDLEWAVTPENMFSKGKNTPLIGQTLKGRAKLLFIAGKRVI